jgi:hypothetical protein
MANKFTALQQLEIIEYNIKRMKVLVECDFPLGTKVNLHCVLQSKAQLLNLEKEIWGDTADAEINHLEKLATLKK